MLHESIARQSQCLINCEYILQVPKGIVKLHTSVTRASTVVVAKGISRHEQALETDETNKASASVDVTTTGPCPAHLLAAGASMVVASVMVAVVV